MTWIPFSRVVFSIIIEIAQQLLPIFFATGKTCKFIGTNSLILEYGI
jgi:hypothetical protein